MKTIGEYLEELPEPYRREAIDNCNKFIMTDTTNSQKEALLYAFHWEDSPQKEEYWHNLYCQLPPEEKLSATAKSAEAPKQHTTHMHPKYNDIPVATITAVFGTDVTTMTANDCLNAIKANNAAAKALTDTGITSAYIDEQVNKYKAANEVLIRQLDSFAKAPTA